MPTFQIGDAVRTTSVYGETYEGIIAGIQVLHGVRIYDIHISPGIGIAAWEPNIEKIEPSQTQVSSVCRSAA